MSDQEFPEYIRCIDCKDEYYEKCPICPHCNFDHIGERFFDDKDNLMIEIKRGEIDIDITDLYGHTFLSWEVSFPDSKYVARLLELGADPNLRDYSGTPPLFHAAGEHATSHMRALVEYGGDPNPSRPGDRSLRIWISEYQYGNDKITDQFMDELEEIAENYNAGQIIKPAKQ